MGGGPEHAGQEHLSQERREWVVQRVAWAVMALALVAALLGVFGKGPLSQRTLTSDPPGLRLDYERMVRFQAETELRLLLAGPGHGDVVLSIGGGYFEHLELKSIVPEPVEHRSAEGLLAAVFRRAREGEPVEVRVRVKVERVGPISGTVSVEAGDTPRRVSFEQFALP